jgi:hypothetical protein
MKKSLRIVGMAVLLVSAFYYFTTHHHDGDFGPTGPLDEIVTRPARVEITEAAEPQTFDSEE